MDVVAMATANAAQGFVLIKELIACGNIEIFVTFG